MKIFICEFCEFETDKKLADKLSGLCTRDDGSLVEVDESKEVVAFDKLGDLWDGKDTQ